MRERSKKIFVFAECKCTLTTVDPFESILHLVLNVEQLKTEKWLSVDPPLRHLNCLWIRCISKWRFESILQQLRAYEDRNIESGTSCGGSLYGVNLPFFWKISGVQRRTDCVLITLCDLGVSVYVSFYDTNFPTIDFNHLLQMNFNTFSATTGSIRQFDK